MCPWQQILKAIIYALGGLNEANNLRMKLGTAVHMHFEGGELT